MSGLVFGCECEAGRCLDPKHNAFWEPENWPGGQAPCRWVYHTDRGSLSVDVWVPDHCVGDAPLSTNLWWSSQGAHLSAVENVRAWIRMERELDDELTPLIDAHRELEEVRELVGAFPA